MVQTAAMLQGHGDVYRQGMADWNAMLPDSRQAALKRKIAEIRARVPAGSGAAAG
jgi:hypothetical protein